MDINERDRFLQRRYLKNKDLKYVPLSQLQFEMHLVDHCNLNCVGCDNFSPLAEPWFADLEKTESDFARLRELFFGQCRYIRLLGGEPLLHPQVNDFIRLAREYFQDAALSIVTNGTLLGRMSDAFFETCLSEGVQISISRYPIPFDYESALTQLRSMGIDAFFNNQVEKTMYRNPISSKGERDRRDSFILCHRSNNCITLRDGKLYTCSLIPVIGILNRAFGTGFAVSEQDYVDLRSTMTGQEILSHLACPPDFCRYCNLRNAQFDIPWRVSERVPEEWIDDTKET